MNPVSQFVAFGLALTFAIVAVFLWALLRKPAVAKADNQDDDAARIYREELQELQATRQSGAIDADAFERARQDIAVRLLQDLPDDSQTGRTENPSAQRAVVTAVVLALVFPLLGAVAYLTLGDPMAVAEPAPTLHGGRQEAPDFAALAQGLKDKLQANPQDTQSWVLLGRTYRSQDQFDAALDAYNHAVALDQDTRLAIERAEVIAAKNGGRFAGEPWDVIRGILKKNPKDANALLLAGSAAFSEGQFTQAIGYWGALRPLLADGSQEAVAVDDALRAAADKAGVAPPPAARAPVTAGGAAAAVSGRVTLSDAIRKQVQATDVVFIYAQAEQGSPMPLAIQRTTVQALPFDFTLDDSMAMSPQARLSGQTQVTVKARISKSGQAMPQPGDWIGTIPHVSVGSHQLTIAIDQMVK